MVWGNFNINNRNTDSTFTANFGLTAVDALGATHYETGQQLMHIACKAADPTTSIVGFEKMNMTCS